MVEVLVPPPQARLSASLSVSSPLQQQPLSRDPESEETKSSTSELGEEGKRAQSRETTGAYEISCIART